MERRQDALASLDISTMSIRIPQWFQSGVRLSPEKKSPSVGDDELQRQLQTELHSTLRVVQRPVHGTLVNGCCLPLFS